MIYLSVEKIEYESGLIENPKRAYLVPRHMIIDANEIEGRLVVRTSDGRTFTCNQVLDHIIGQLEHLDYTGQIDELMAAIDGIGEVLGKALCKVQEYRSEDISSRPVC